MVLKVTGASLATTVAAGCLGDDDDGTAAENGDNGAADIDWLEVDEIYLEGHSSGWVGIEPAGIEGETNPELQLIEGETYDFRWVNEDGAPHNIEIRDEDDEVVDDYATELLDEQGEEQTLEDVEITDEMVDYVCDVHPNPQRGSIDVQEP